eukprot:12419789-Karenia_brevis.AAC.1
MSSFFSAELLVRASRSFDYSWEVWQREFSYPSGIGSSLSYLSASNERMCTCLKNLTDPGGAYFLCMVVGNASV